MLQHSEITIPWTTAKLLSYYIQVFLTIHEAENGKIRLPGVFCRHALILLR